jgi:hypothetical protein
VWSLAKLRPYLYGRNISVATDNNALKWLFSKKEVQGKLARWITAIQDFQINIRHIKGKDNLVADALSRAPVGIPEFTDPAEMLICTLVENQLPAEDVALLQLGDPSLRSIVQQLQENSSKNPDPDFMLHDGVLYRKNRGTGRNLLLVIPSILRQDLIRACHDEITGGHLGMAKTQRKIEERYWWPSLQKGVHAYVQSCPNCQFNKPQTGKPVGELMPISPPEYPFDTIGMDHLGPLKRTARGNRYILVIIDHLSKWLIAAAVPDAKARSVLKILNHQIIPQHGVVKRIITDRGAAFTSEAFRNCLRNLGIKHVIATTERPQTNGLVERMNRTLGSALRAYVNKKQTD